MEYFNHYLDVWKKYAVFGGRSSRSEYWYFTLFSLLAWVVLGIVANIIKTDLLSNIYGLAAFVPSLAVSVRRLHDTGRSGWWVLIGLIPVVGWIVLIVFFAQESQSGSNTYGSNPLGMTSPAAPAPTTPNTPPVGPTGV